MGTMKIKGKFKGKFIREFTYNEHQTVRGAGYRIRSSNKFSEEQPVDKVQLKILQAAALKKSDRKPSLPKMPWDTQQTD